MMFPKVSIVIPVYNVKKEYMKTCISSVIGQTYENIEIIIVDDGSSSGIEEYCDSISKTDPRVLVYHQKNQGVSAARNTGIKLATGKYILFVDADDIVSDFMVESAVYTAEKENADLVIGLAKTINNYSEFLAKRNDVEHCISDSKKIEIYKRKIFHISGKNELCDTKIEGFVARGAYTKFVRADIAKKTGFPLNIPYGEDEIWILRLLNECNRVFIKEEVWYGYLQYENSSLLKYNEQRESHFYSFLSIIYEENKVFLEKYPQALVKSICDEMIILIRYHFLSKECPLSLFEKRKSLKNIVGKYNIIFLKDINNSINGKQRLLLFICSNGLWIPLFKTWDVIKKIKI